MAEIDTLFLTKTAEKHTSWARTYLYSLSKGVPPPRVAIEKLSLADAERSPPSLMFENARPRLGSITSRCFGK